MPDPAGSAGIDDFAKRAGTVNADDIDSDDIADDSTADADNMIHNCRGRRGHQRPRHRRGAPCVARPRHAARLCRPGADDHDLGADPKADDLAKAISDSDGKAVFTNVLTGVLNNVVLDEW